MSIRLCNGTVIDLASIAGLWLDGFTRTLEVELTEEHLARELYATSPLFVTGRDAKRVWDAFNKPTRPKKGGRK